MQPTVKVIFLQDFIFQNQQYHIGDTEDLGKDIYKELKTAKVVDKFKEEKIAKLPGKWKSTK